MADVNGTPISFHGDAVVNAAYIAHAANAYPKLVEALKVACDALHHAGSYRTEADCLTFLRSLGEDE